MRFINHLLAFGQCLLLASNIKLTISLKFYCNGVTCMLETLHLDEEHMFAFSYPINATAQLTVTDVNVGVVRSRSESTGVRVIRSRPESIGDDRNRSWLESTGTARCNVLMVRHFISLHSSVFRFSRTFRIQAFVFVNSDRL